MSPADDWIDVIFTKLTLTYGQAFLRRWQDIELEDVKNDWAHELAGFERHPQSIAWALQNLPIDKPPTVLEFRAIARRAPAPDAPRLEVSPAGKSRVASELQKLAPIVSGGGRRDPKQWAHDLIARIDAGHKVTRTVEKMARAAIAERSIFPGGAA